MKKFITAFFLLFLFFSNNYSHAAGGWLGIQMATLDQKTIEGFKLPQNTPQNVLITTVIKNSAGTPTQADWGVYESQIERSSLTVTGTNENKNFTTYECVLSLFLPFLLHRYLLK